MEEPDVDTRIQSEMIETQHGNAGEPGIKSFPLGRSCHKTRKI